MKIKQFLKEHYILISIMLLGAFLRLYHLDFQSPWLDEMYTLNETNPNKSFSEVLPELLAREQQPHLYFILLRFLNLILGQSLYVIRFFSVIVGLTGIYAIYLLGKSLFDKKTGIIAAVLLSVNYFHVWYSQEARPYAMFFMFSTFAFYRLIVYIKNSNRKNAIIYGIFASLMIYGHFFGLFILFSQYLILLVFLVLEKKDNKKTFFINSFIAGIITFLLWIPTIKVFLIVTKIKSFWIQPPNLEVFTQLYKEFFGNSEMILFFAFVFSLFYFFNLFNEKKPETSLSKNKFIFSFLILSFWIFIGLIIPLIRSYLEIPMIVSRYYISLLPAVILIFAIGISSIKNNTTLTIVLSIFVLVSITDIFIIKDYYNKINKSQFREISAKINEKNISKSRIVSEWGWHFGYYLNSNTSSGKVIERKFQDYISDLKAKPDSEPFWYVDAHFHPYKLNPDEEQFLKDNYNVIENIEYFDTWAKYYVPKSASSNLIVLDINQFEPVKSENGVNILMFSNSTTKSKPINLEAGDYTLSIKARSLPDPPIQNQNANITIAIDGNEIGAYFLSEKEDKTDYFLFKVNQKKEITISLTFGNDMVEGTKDRNALIYSVNIEKVKK